MSEPLTDKQIMEETPDDDYLRMIILNAGRKSFHRKPRWSHVSDLTLDGCGVSMALCRRFNIDPDEIVGRNLENYEDCPTCGTDLLNDEEEDDE